MGACGECREERKKCMRDKRESANRKSKRVKDSARCSANFKSRMGGGLGGEADRSDCAAESLMVLDHSRGCRQAVPHGGSGNHEGPSV